ncbi:MAG TPA: hypothetical protein VFG25_08240 [Nitrosopumilaceae archaeon]|nr:hypothetical protein [Nitrosopumilaceae archaeon]
MLKEENFAGNIIINLASLPDFLRKPILKKRLTEFFSMTEHEKNEVIVNALEAGPSIPFPNFSKLFRTWLEILVTFNEFQRNELFLRYLLASIRWPQKLIDFNLDGILEIFMTLNEKEKSIISKSIIEIISGLDPEKKRIAMTLIPDNAKRVIGL